MPARFVYGSNVSASGSSEELRLPMAHLKPSDGWSFDDVPPHKCAQFAGHFRVTDALANLDFKESAGGSEKTATVATDNYSRPELLAEGIRAPVTAAASENTYVYQREDRRWGIKTAGPYLDLLWASGTNAANSIGGLLGFDTTADDTGATNYVGDYVAAHTDEYVTVGPASSYPTAVAIAGLRASPAAVVSIQGDLASFDSPALDLVFPVNDHRAMGYYIEPVANYLWRVRIEDRHNPWPIRVARLIIGSHIETSRGPSINFPLSTDMAGNVQTREKGTDYLNESSVPRTFDLEWSSRNPITESEYEAIYSMVRQLAAASAVFVDLSPPKTAAGPADPDLSMFCYIEDAKFGRLISGNYTATLSCREVVL